MGERPVEPSERAVSIVTLNRREAGLAALCARVMLKMAQDKGDFASADEVHALARKFEHAQGRLPDLPIP